MLFYFENVIKIPEEINCILNIMNTIKMPEEINCI